MAPRISASSLTRRRFLIGAGAGTGAVLLGACGGGDDTAGGTTTSSTTTPAGGGLVLAQFFGGPVLVAGEESRAPFGVADTDGLLPVEDTPEELTVTLLDPDGAPVGDPIQVGRRATGLPRAYFPLKFTAPAAGFYTARTELGGANVEMAIQVDDAADVPVVQPGAPLPALATPTTADAAGVDPICTAEPACPLHDVSVADALAEQAPIALLVSTPAFCQVAICGPVLDILLAKVGAHPNVRFVHAEVYAHPATDPQLVDYAETVAALGLSFEPCLVLAGADGTVTERLDNIFDETELEEALGRLASS
jgi:hypothetical protein